MLRSNRCSPRLYNFLIKISITLLLLLLLLSFYLYSLVAALTYSLLWRHADSKDSQQFNYSIDSIREK